MNAGPRVRWWEGLIVLAIAILVNCIGIGHNGFYDEYYHVLAARSWLEDGTFRIADGTYSRAGAYTIVVAQAFALFGESLVAGRMISAVAGAALVSLVFVWTASVSNRAAGYIAAFLLCLSPDQLFVSQIIRFYALHALLIWVAACAVYVLVRHRQSLGRQAALLLTAIAALGAARTLHVTTLIAVVGLAAWAVPTAWLESPRNDGARSSGGWLVSAGVLLLLAAILFLFDQSRLDALWQSFRHAPLWAASAQNQVLFYHWWLLDNYPALWSLMPVAILAACIIAPRPAVFCTVVLATVIGLHSLAGTKGGRYIAYAMPFLFALWGMALYGASIGLVKLARRATIAVLGDTAPATLRLLLVSASFVVSAAFLLASTPVLRTSYKMLTLQDSEWPTVGPELRGFPDWQAAAPRLRAIATDGAVVVASAGLKALYFLDKLDFDLNRTVAAEGGGDFDTDRRTGKRLIGSVEAMQTVLECHPRGLVIVEQRHWGRPWAVSDPITDLLEREAQPVELPPATRLIAYVWSHAPPPDPAACASRMSPIPRNQTRLVDDDE